MDASSLCNSRQGAHFLGLHVFVIVKKEYTMISPSLHLHHHWWIQWNARAPSQLIFFIFMQFFLGEIDQYNRLASLLLGLASPSGKFWIRHSSYTDDHVFLRGITNRRLVTGFEFLKGVQCDTD